MSAPLLSLVTLHAGFSHSSLALRSLKAFCHGEPFYDGIAIHEWTLKADPDAMAAELTTRRPALLGFSVYLWNVTPSLALAHRVKAARPETVIVLGGPEAGPRAEALLRSHPAIDFVVDGEGEQAFRDLARWVLHGYGDPADIPGLVWRQGEALRRNPPQAMDPAELVSPLLLGLLDRSKPLVYWETSRGCPFRCTFCTSATDRLRTFPEERIARELAVLGELEQKTVKLLDRSFHLGKGRTLGLLERFLATPASLRFHLELNPDRISAEALALFASAPADKFQFEIGLQTLDTAVLARIERHMAVPTALANIRQLVALKRHRVHLDLIVGLPGETARQCRDSLDRVFALFADHLQLGTLKLLPGTPLREQAAAFGYAFDPEPPYEVRHHPALGSEDFERFKAYGELLERLWNSALVPNALMRLVTAHFGDSVSALFDSLLEAAPGLTKRPSPETAFAAFARWAAPWIATDPVLSELLAWDYGHYALPGRGCPEAVARQVAGWEMLPVEGGRKRLPLFALSAEAAAIVNRRRRREVEAGCYALWPRKHLKGRPVVCLWAGTVVANGTEGGAA